VLNYVIFGSATSFYKQKEVKDSLCFLRWLYNERDRIAMLRAITTPKRGIGNTAIREFDQFCALVDGLWNELSPITPKPTPLQILFHLSGDDSWCTWEDAKFPPHSVSLSTRSFNLLTSFSTQMRGIRDKAYIATVEQVLSAIVEDMELIPHLDKISKSKTEFEERQANVRELQQASRRYSKEGPCLPRVKPKSNEDEFTQSPLGNFLDDVALVTDMADSSDFLSCSSFGSGSKATSTRSCCVKAYPSPRICHVVSYLPAFTFWHGHGPMQSILLAASRPRLLYCCPLPRSSSSPCWDVESWCLALVK
jgi:superfamily I DNA/RNA helicase